MKVTLRAVGKLKSFELKSLLQEYEKRLTFTFLIQEIEIKKKLSAHELKTQQTKLLLQGIPSTAWVIALDERGENVTSMEFAQYFKKIENQGVVEVFFLIGGADGLEETARQRANLLLSFGQLTWPHMMVRLMLAEQLYRAQQINAGHPYHKE